MKINTLLAITFLSIIIYATIDEMHGIVGLTKRDGGVGCVCHDLNPSDSVVVWIEGPDSVIKNTTQQYKILMTGGPSVAGGFNIASYFGNIDSVDTLTHVLFGELTHTAPNPFSDDTVSWNFLYTAPDSLLIDTIYSAANSVNWDSIPSFPDQWNFGQNFIIHIIDTPVDIENEIQQLKDFILYQNYPNPFNPVTSIQYAIGNRQLIRLIVYDILGNKIVTLVDEAKDAGIYKVDFNSSAIKQLLSSGIYIYQLSAGNFTQTNKMVLLK
jgi:hypothetical protein